MLYDKRGIPIHEGDVLKMFHFIGARRKKYYMYKWVVVRDGHLCGHHLGRGSSVFYLSQELLRDTEIVQGFDGGGQTFEDRSRRE